jgi:hypothetical protein
MTDRQLAEIFQGQLEALKILRTDLFALKLFLKKTGVLDPDAYRQFRNEVEKAMAVTEETAELERLLGLSPDKSSGTP